MEPLAKRRQTVHYQRGRLDRVAVVFSCPGRQEELAGRPAARNTGSNLDILLSLLARELNRDDLSREDVTITNAWPGVEYRAKTGRAEASEREVTSPGNIERLRRELDEITDLVIFCGGRARAASRLLRLKHRPRFVYIRHPGLRGLSLISTDAHGERIVAADAENCAAAGVGLREARARNTRRRLEVLARSIREQLEAPSASS